MERRELLRGGLVVGATLAARRGAWAADNGASLPAITFYEGLLAGAGFQGWPFSFSVTGTRVQGLAFDPATAEGELQGLRFEGRVEKLRRLVMNVFTLEDVNHLSPIGMLLGIGNRGLAQGTFVLPQPPKRLGSFNARAIAISEAETQALVGDYQAVAENQAGSMLYDAMLFLRPGMEWELVGARAAPGLPPLEGAVARRLKGRYAVATDGRLLLNMTRVPLRLQQPGKARSPAPSAAPPGNASRGRGPATEVAHERSRARGRRRRRRARPAAGPVTFSDATFTPADWTATKIEDTSPGSSATFLVAQGEAGGNPGPHRRTTLSWFGDGELLALIQVGHVRNSFSYDPASSGAIGSIGFSWDLLEVDPSGEGATCRYFLLLLQGDTYYLSSGAFDNVNPGGWRSISHVGLRAVNFTRVTGPGPPNPDFPATGAPIRFGFISLGTTFSGERVCVSGLDNYSVEVTPEAGLRRVTLVGTDEPGAGVPVEYVATVLDASDEPVVGAPVLFELRVEGALDAEAAVPSDANGQARFQHTFSTAQINRRFVLTACVDEDGNGVCDPLEPSDEIDGFVEAVRVTIDGPTSAEPSSQVCYTVEVEVGGTGVAGAPVLLFQEGVTAPVAQGVTGDGGSVQLCFTTPATPGSLGLFACWDLDGNGACDEGEPRSSTRELTVSPPPPPEAEVECDECCLGTLIIALQTPSARVSVGGATGADLCIEHPFTHLVGCFTRVP